MGEHDADSLELEQLFSAAQERIAPESRARAAAAHLQALTAAQLGRLLVAASQREAGPDSADVPLELGGLTGLVAKASPNLPGWEDLDISELLPQPFGPQKEARSVSYRPPSVQCPA